MAISRSDLQAQIYDIISKSPTAYGLITPQKVNAAIQDSLDFISTKMMKIMGGWLTSIAYADIEAGNPYVELPPGLAIVNFVKRKNAAGDYEPLDFYENYNNPTVTTQVATTSVGFYRFSSGKLYLEQIPQTDLENGIMFDGVFYPDQLISDGSEISGDLDNRAFINYAKWRSASQLHSLSSDAAPTWAASEIEWKQASLEIIARRFREPTTIQGFR